MDGSRNATSREKLLMSIGGGRYIRYAVWIWRKKAQVFIRTHLSHVLALVLAITVLLREEKDLGFIAFSGRWPTSFQWLVLVLTLGTLAAALWEFFGNKLSSSKQEIRFVQGIRSLLFELEKFAHGEDRTAEPDKRLIEFIDGFLEVACSTLCAHCRVDAGLMVKLPGVEKLRLIKSSKSARYPAGLEIPLPSGTDNESGPAGYSFSEAKLGYVPKKSRSETWLFQVTDKNPGCYDPASPRVGWIKAEKKDLEDFRSVLCVPTAIYRRRGVKRRFGVLNFSTKKRDPFVDRDFMMAECFASILSQAFAITREDKLASDAGGKA
jgi:hypothetical protein